MRQRAANPNVKYPEDYEFLLDHTLEEAKRHIDEEIREITVDGKDLDLVYEYRADRLNVGTKDGKICDIFGFG
jgi:PAS domain-containing protein